MSTNPFERTLRPASELAADKPHGTRIRYVGGCRCLPCRCANANYAKARQHARLAGDTRDLVPVDRVRAHLEALSRAGVGRRQISRAARVPESTLGGIRAGKRTKIRAHSERRILAITAAQLADGMTVDARTTWVRIRSLQAEGFTLKRIAHELGYENAHALQLAKVRIRKRNADAVERLWRKWMTIEGR